MSFAPESSFHLNSDNLSSKREVTSSERERKQRQLEREKRRLQRQAILLEQKMKHLADHEETLKPTSFTCSFDEAERKKREDAEHREWQLVAIRAKRQQEQMEARKDRLEVKAVYENFSYSMRSREAERKGRIDRIRESKRRGSSLPPGSLPGQRGKPRRQVAIETKSETAEERSLARNSLPEPQYDESGGLRYPPPIPALTKIPGHNGSTSSSISSRFAQRKNAARSENRSMQHAVASLSLVPQIKSKKVRPDGSTSGSRNRVSSTRSRSTPPSNSRKQLSRSRPSSSPKLPQGRIKTQSNCIPKTKPTGREIARGKRIIKGTSEKAAVTPSKVQSISPDKKTKTESDDTGKTNTSPTPQQVSLESGSSTKKTFAAISKQGSNEESLGAPSSTREEKKRTISVGGALSGLGEAITVMVQSASQMVTHSERSGSTQHESVILNTPDVNNIKPSLASDDGRDLANAKSTEVKNMEKTRNIPQPANDVVVDNANTTVYDEIKESEHNIENVTNIHSLPADQALDLNAISSYEGIVDLKSANPSEGEIEETPKSPAAVAQSAEVLGSLSCNINDKLLILLEEDGFDWGELDKHFAGGADANFRNEDSGKTALMQASFLNNEAAVTALLKAGADPKLSDRNGKTALDYANIGGNKNIEEMLRKVVTTTSTPTGASESGDLQEGSHNDALTKTSASTFAERIAKLKSSRNRRQAGGGVTKKVESE